MCIETNIELELLAPTIGNVQRLHLEVKLNDSPHCLSADLMVEGDRRIVLTQAEDTFGLKIAARQMLALVLCSELSRYLGNTPQGGTVTWVRWVEPDLTPWIRTHLYEPAATQVVRTLSAHSSIHQPRLLKGFTESMTT